MAVRQTVSVRLARASSIHSGTRSHPITNTPQTRGIQQANRQLRDIIDLSVEIDCGNGFGSLLSDIQLFEQITRFKVIDQHDAVRIAADREAFLVGTQSEPIELLDVAGADRA